MVQPLFSSRLILIRRQASRFTQPHQIRRPFVPTDGNVSGSHPNCSIDLATGKETACSFPPPLRATIT
jgi:hypothetical protein